MSLVNIITGYTPDYRDYADRLILSGRNHGHEVTAYMVPPVAGNDWLAGTRIKATAILRAMHELDGPILWVDADAEIVKPLDQFQLRVWKDKYDVAAPHTIHARRRIFYVGTLWFQNGPHDRQFVGRWKEMCKRAKPHHGDEYLFECVRSDLQAEEFPIRWGFMSYRWAYIPRAPIDPHTALIKHHLSGKASEYAQGLSEEQKREVGHA